MSRSHAGWLDRFSKEFFVSPSARRLRRQKRRSQADAVASRPVSIVDDALEQRLMLSAVTISSDDIQAADITIASTDEVDPSADFLTVDAGVTVRSTTGSVTLNAGDDLNLGVGATISAVSVVNLGLDTGDADSGTGSTATLQNMFGGTLVNVTGGPDNDSVVLSPSAFDDVPMDIDLLGGTANSLEVDLTGVTAPVLTYTSSTDGTITSSSHETVTFSSVQSVNVTTGTGAFDEVVLNLSSLVAGNDGSDDTTVVTANGADIEVAVNGVLVASIPSVDADAITINGSNDDDTFRIDHSTGLITVPININGQVGNDLASVKGDDVESAVYTPDATTTGDGTVAVTNAGLLTFTELEPLDVSNMATATLDLPSANDVLSIDEGFDFDSGTIPALVVSGTTAAVAIESVAFFNNGAVVVDTSTSDGTDTVTVNGASNAHGNAALIIETGGTSADGDAVNLNGGINVTSDFSVSGAAIHLQDHISITSGGTLTFGDGTVDGAFDLNLTSNSLVLNGEVGGTTPLMNLTVSTGGATLIGANVTVSGAVAVGNDATVVGGININGASVTFEGDLAPGGFGDDTDVLTISDNLILSDRAGDDLTLHVTGKTTAGVDYDQLVVNGSVTLDGVLGIVGTFTETGVSGDEIVLIDNDGSDAVVGAFSNFANGDIVVLNGQDWRLLYDGGDGNDVSLRFGSDTSVSIRDAMVSEGDSGTAVLTFTVTSTTAIGEAFRVTYATADNTAESTSDYTAVNSSVSFLGTVSGETQTISIDINGDELVERHESLLLSLTNILDTSNASFSDSIGVGTITNDDTANVVIDSAIREEGDSGTAMLVFTVSLDANVDTPFSVDYATADNTATVADSDYVSTSGTLNFSGALPDAQTISIQINGDATPEFDEVFDVVLSNLSASGRDVVLSSSSATGTIVDDDRVPVELSVSATSGSESAETVITVTATADEPVAGNQSIDIALTGTGISAGDYSLSSPTIQIADGQTVGSVTLTIVDDEIVELTEVATVAFSSPSGGIRVGTVGSATVSIASDDAATLTIAATDAIETDSGTTDLTFNVTLDKAVDTPLSVDFSTADGTATVADSDYASATGTLNFTGGGGEVQTVTVTINGDEVVELDEVFLVALSNLNGNGRPVSLSTSSAAGTITNDDAATISIADVTAVEQDSGQSTFEFVVTLSDAVDSTVSANASTADDSATTSDNDYVAMTDEEVVFVGTAGEQQSVFVTVNGDRFVEPDEAFQVLLTSLNSSGRNVTLADDTAVGSITNDDSPVPVNLSSSVLTGSESAGTVITLTVTADQPVGGDQTIDLSLAGIDPTDAVLSAESVTIPHGGTTGSVTLTILDDAIVEAIETVVVSMGNLSAGLTGGATTSASISIVDDDAATISINDISVQEGDSGTTDFHFTVSLSAVVDGSISLNYATATSTALASDFTAASGSIGFAALSTDSQTITVSVAGDSVVELNEEFLVNLAGLSASGLNVTFADNQGRATILNDDQATLSINDVAVTEGDAGTSVYSFNVTLSHDVDSAVSVDYSTADSTATAPADYTAITSNTIAFTGTVGEIETIQVLVVAEMTQEIDEEFFVDLVSVNASGRDVVIADGRGSGTIIDDDGIAVNLSADAVSGTEAGTSTITLTATADSAVTGNQTMNVSVIGDRVTASDYVLSSNTITILDGATTGTVTLTVSDDDLTEVLETATVSISGFPVALSGGNTTSVDIDLVDNDQTTLSVADVTVFEGASGSSTAMFTVVADNAVDSGFTVDYSTADGTATVVDGDYTAQPLTTLNFTGTAGQLLQFAIDVAGDQAVELDETFLVNFLNLQAAGRNVVLDRSSATATITNDDAASLAIADVRMAEGNSGTTVFEIDVTLSHDVDTAFTVDYSTVDGTAVAGSDFTPVSGATLNFAGNSGEVQTAAVSVTGDTVAERDEAFQVVLQGLAIPGGRLVSIADGTADVTIADDDGVVVNFGVSSTSGSEEDGTVITLVASAAQPLAQAETVDLVVTGTDIDGSDYTLSTTSISIAAGQTIGTAMFTVLDDTLVEGLETAVISITNPSVGIALGPVTTQLLEITSDDDATLTVMDQTVVESDAGTVSVTFSVILSDAVDNGFTVDFATSDGTATTADNDYVASTGTLTFVGASQEVQTVTVVVNGDTDSETDETFSLMLSNLVAGTAMINLPSTPATGTIANDDGATLVNISVSPVATTEANETTVTITAVAESPVVGDQTVVVDISGGGVSSADYSFPSTTITILDGEMFGTVDLQILDDSDIEAASETMVVALTSPSAGLVLGLTVTADVTIQDSSVVVPDAIDRFQEGQPTLSWAAVPGATGYEVWFSRIFPEVAVLEVDRDVTGTSWQVPENLDPAMYRYWIRAKDADGDFTAWSAASQFEVRPQLISPIGGAFTRTPTFEWEAIPFASAYELYLSSSNGVERIENIQGTSYTPTEALPEGEVRWWIRAEEAIGNRGWSAVGFAGSEVKPVLLAPIGNKTATLPTFTWSPVPGAGRYALYVQNLDTSEVVINDATLTSNSYTPGSSLVSGNYRFWVKAIDAATNDFNSGLWSNPVDFTIAEADTEDRRSALPELLFASMDLLTQPLLIQQVVDSDTSVSFESWDHRGSEIVNSAGDNVTQTGIPSPVSQKASVDSPGLSVEAEHLIDSLMSTASDWL